MLSVLHLEQHYRGGTCPILYTCIISVNLSEICRHATILSSPATLQFWRPFCVKSSIIADNSAFHYLSSSILSAFHTCLHRDAYSFLYIGTWFCQLTKTSHISMLFNTTSPSPAFKTGPNGVYVLCFSSCFTSGSSKGFPDLLCCILFICSRMDTTTKAFTINFSATKVYQYERHTCALPRSYCSNHVSLNLCININVGKKRLLGMTRHYH